MNQFTNKNHPHYIGLTESFFEDRLYKHKNLFKYENKRNATELSDFIWDQKSKNIDVSLEWSILEKATIFTRFKELYALLNREVPHLIFGTYHLNKHNELISKCRHENKYYLSNYKSVPP